VVCVFVLSDVQYSEIFTRIVWYRTAVSSA
jgi:hypothetical protein